VIKIGGRDETVPLTLRVADGTYVDVTVRGKDLAKRLAPLLFGQEVRVAGLATWRRDGKGEWSCVGMVVDSFEVPDATLPSQMFSTLSELPENGWHSLDDPISEWRKLRGDE